eukprot:s164_g5.t1
MPVAIRVGQSSHFDGGVLVWVYGVPMEYEEQLSVFESAKEMHAKTEPKILLAGQVASAAQYRLDDQQEQPRQAGRLVMRQDPWKASSGAKLRLGRPVPVSRPCLQQDEQRLAKSPIGDPASRDGAVGEDDLEPLAPAEEYMLGSPAASSSRQPENSWEPTFKAKAPEGYRRWQPRGAGPTPTPSPQPGSVGVRRRRWEWPTSEAASPARGGPLGPPLPGTLVYAHPQDLPPAAAPPEDDEQSDGIARAMSPKARIGWKTNVLAVSLAQVSKHVKKELKRHGCCNSTVEACKRGLPPGIADHLWGTLAWRTPAQPILVARPGKPKGTDWSLTVRLRGEEGERKGQVKSELARPFPASVAIQQDFPAVDKKAETSEKSRSYTSEDISAEKRPQKDSKGEVVLSSEATPAIEPQEGQGPDSDRAAAASAEPLAAKKSKKATSNKAKSASFLSDDESGSEAQTLPAPFAGGLLKPAKGPARQPSPPESLAVPVVGRQTTTPSGGGHSSVCGQGCDAPPLPTPIPSQGVTEARIAVLTASDRATSGVYEDKSGPAVVEAVADPERGYL